MRVAFFKRTKNVQSQSVAAQTMARDCVLRTPKSLYVDPHERIGRTFAGYDHLRRAARSSSMSTYTSSFPRDPVFVGASPTADIPTFMAAMEREFPDIPSHKIYEAYEDVLDDQPELVHDEKTLKARLRSNLRRTGST